MFKFITINEGETKEQYYNRMAQIVNAIETGAAYDGMDLRLIYTEEALASMRACIFEQLYNPIQRVAGKVASEVGILYMVEDFSQSVAESVLSNFYKFNNPDFRLKDEDGAFVPVSFSKFIRFCAKEPMRKLLQQETGCTKRISLMLRKISRTEEHIMKMTGAHLSDLTPAVIAEFMPDIEENPLSEAQIREALAMKKVFISVDAGDDDNSLEPADESDPYIIADEAIERFLRRWIDGMKPHKKMIFLQACEFCPDEYADMTIKEFSCDECLIDLCRRDNVARKNIEHGSVNIERQGRKDVHMDSYKDCDYVKEDHIAWMRTATNRDFKKYILDSSVQMDELLHQVERFFKSYWNEMMEEYFGSEE